MILIAYLVGLALGIAMTWFLSKAHNFEKDAYIAGYKKGFQDHTKLIKRICATIMEIEIKESEEKGEQKE